MANTPSAKKRIRNTLRKTDINKSRRSRIKTFVRKVEDALESKDAKAANNINLASWCERQRQKFRKGTLPAQYVKRLEAIGFNWDPMTQQWEDAFVLLCKYKEKNGNTCPPQRETTAGIDLGGWCSRQRQQYKKGKLSQERIDRLEMIGFRWSWSN